MLVAVPAIDKYYRWQVLDCFINHENTNVVVSNDYPHSLLSFVGRLTREKCFVVVVELDRGKK